MEMEKEKEKESGSAKPTGCYKCGLPGHWSRDCKSTNPIPNSNSSSRPPFSSSNYIASSKPYEKPVEKVKKAPKKRPKLTAERLLSDDGIGFVLKHFPQAFKFRGRGHEVGDLGNLIDMYKDWHSHLLPYYSFDQFVQKVEKVGASRHVRTCVRDLRERVANGGDPSKVHEAPVEHDVPDSEPAVEELHNFDDIVGDVEHQPSSTSDANDIEEELATEIIMQATEESTPYLPSQATNDPAVHNHCSTDGPISHGPTSRTPENGASGTSQLTEEQKARIEANLKKALEKRTAAEAAHARSLLAAPNSS